MTPFTCSFFTTFPLTEIPMKDGPIRPFMLIDNPTNNFHLNSSPIIYENHDLRKFLLDEPIAEIIHALVKFNNLYEPCLRETFRKHLSDIYSWLTNMML